MKRKGKGRGKGSRKRRRREAGDGEEEDPRAKRGKEKAKAKEAAKAAAEAARLREEQEAEEARKRAAARRAKPGFSQLLQAFGVAEDPPTPSEEDEDGSEGEEAAEGAVPGPEMQDQAEGEEEEPFEDDEDPEEESEEEKDAEPEESSGLDFFERFWEDPPLPLHGPGSARTTGSSRLSLPGLARCEAHGCEMEALMKLMESKGKAKLPEALLKPWCHFRLAAGLRKAFENLLEALKDQPDITIGPAEGAFFACLHAYLDVSFPQHSHLNARALRVLSALHIVDHLLKVRGEDQAKDQKPEGEVQMDQGFTRARVLILCPFRSACYDFVKLLLALMPPKKQVANLQRFEEEFGPDGEILADKPPDYQHLFGGNSDDRFRIGLTLLKKGVKLYAPFHNAEILICSPLGLRQITGAEGERRREFDFLSSIEVCIVDRADVLHMQNWEHLQEVMQVVNCKPQGLGSIDISRLRPQFAENRGREFRQTVVTSCGQFLDAEALFKLSSAAEGPPAKGASLAARLRAPQLGRSKRGGRSLDLNEEQEDIDAGMSLDMLKSAQKASKAPKASQGLRGLAKLAALPEGQPLRQAIALGSRQFFLHTPCGPLSEQSDRLFEAFESRYWRPLGSSLEGLLLVATTYYNFLRLRRFLREEGASFGSIFEYSSNQALSRARFKFFHGEQKMLLVTERFLWYRRYRLRGANYVLFFGVPQTPEIYEEMLSGVRVPSTCNSMCLYTQHDAFALERVVGHERVKSMLTSAPGKVFVYS